MKSFFTKLKVESFANIADICYCWSGLEVDDYLVCAEYWYLGVWTCM